MKALFVIDVQKEYMEKYDAGLLQKINECIQNAYENKELIVYVKNVRKLKSGEMSYEFADGLKILSDNIIYKKTSGVFSESKLTELFEKNNVTEFDVIGVDGCCCVAKSAEEGINAGYKTAILCNCIGVLNPERYEKKKSSLTKLGVKYLNN